MGEGKNTAGGAGFQTTCWTDVHAVHDPEDRREAMNRLAARYWPAVYARVRRSTRCPDRAAEITQSFFADVVIGRDLFARADPDRGRLRSLILTALRRHQIDLSRRPRARPLPSMSPEAIEREESHLRESGTDDPDTAYERRWAVATFDQALELLQAQLHDAGLPNHWRLAEVCLIDPIRGNQPPPTMAHAATVTGFGSAGQAASALKIVRRRFRVALMDAIRLTADPDHVESELIRFLSVLGSQLRLDAEGGGFRR